VYWVVSGALCVLSCCVLLFLLRLVRSLRRSEPTKTPHMAMTTRAHTLEDATLVTAQREADDVVKAAVAPVSTLTTCAQPRPVEVYTLPVPLRDVDSKEPFEFDVEVEIGATDLEDI
jgi:hypothetical protein